MTVIPENVGNIKKTIKRHTSALTAFDKTGQHIFPVCAKYRPVYIRRH